MTQLYYSFMPVYFADNWTITRLGSAYPMTITFWLTEKCPKYFQNMEKTQHIGKKKTQKLYFHKIKVQKLSPSKQFVGWFVNDGPNVITINLNRRDYTPLVNKNLVPEDDDDDYVKVVKQYTQTPEEINNIICPLELEVVTTVNNDDDCDDNGLIGIDSWTTATATNDNES
jgi:hypothetical protein